MVKGKDNYGDFVVQDRELPDWLEPEVIDNGSTIKSYVWKTNCIRRIRLTELNLQDKFIAESLVIYPDTTFINPVFGTEFVTLVKDSLAL